MAERLPGALHRHGVTRVVSSPQRRARLTAHLLACDLGVTHVHERVTPIISAVADQIRRPAAYSAKLDVSQAKVRAGELFWLTSIIDSNHRVWFELHEELIRVARLTREDEARSGHAN